MEGTGWRGRRLIALPLALKVTPIWSLMAVEAAPTIIKRGGTLGLSALALLTFIVTHEAQGAMDRSAALFAGAVHKYSSYLYLSELFQKPTAAFLYNNFCGDVHTNEQLKAIKDNIGDILKKDFWDLNCSPVKVTNVQKSAAGTFNFTLRYVRLPAGRWLDALSATIVSGADVNSRLMPIDRQLFLSRSMLPKLNINNFSEYGRSRALGYIIETLQKKGAKFAQETPDDGGMIGEITFTSTR